MHHMNSHANLSYNITETTKTERSDALLAISSVKYYTTAFLTFSLTST